jgi:ABC-type molybdate transport system substrate-binding protein
MSVVRTAFFGSFVSRLLPLAFVAMIFLSGVGAAAHADPLAVMSAGAVGDALKELAADYTKATGVQLNLVFGNVGMIQDRLRAGETADVLILSAAAIDEMGKSGGLAAGGRAILGRIGMGIAIKADQPSLSRRRCWRQNRSLIPTRRVAGRAASTSTA